MLEVKDKYYIARYSIVPYAQMSLLEMLDKRNKETIFRDFFINLKKIKHIDITLNRNKTNNEFCFYFTKKISDNLLLIKFGKKKSFIKGIETDNDLKDIEDETIPWSFIVINLEEQLFLIQHNPDITPKHITMIHFIEECLSKLLKNNNLLLKLELITKSNNFWYYINEYENLIQKVELNMISPNFLGQRYETSKILKELKETYNNTSFKFIIENDQGKLKLFNEFIKNAVQYISNGCGSWKIKILNRKKSFNSKLNPQTYELPKEIYKLTNEQLNDINFVFTKISVLEKNNQKNGDD